MFRSAYIKLSKEYHPDHHIGESTKNTEDIHNKERWLKFNEDCLCVFRLQLLIFMVMIKLPVPYVGTRTLYFVTVP